MTDLPGTDLATRLRLVVVTDATLAGPRGVHATVEAALRGGCRAIQLRDKTGSPAAVLETARALRRLTLRHGALLFLNDRVDVALEAEADGVHLGPTDLPVDAVRRWAGPGLLLGYSTDDPLAAREAVARGADYLGCGAVFGTTTKDVGGEAIGPGQLDRVARAVHVPVVGIGGVNPGNAHQIAATAAAGAAVVGAVMAAADPEAAVQALLRSLHKKKDRPG